MPYCEKCGRKIKLGYRLCYDCHERQKKGHTITWGPNLRFGSGGQRDDRPRPVRQEPQVVIIKTPQDIINEHNEAAKRYRTILKILFLWVIPLVIIISLFPMLFDPRVMKDSSYYTYLIISILWLIGSFYLWKRRGKWI